MAINNMLIKEILTKLNEVYPKKIERMENIFPNHENQEEICSHLFHLKSLGYVEFIDLSSKDGEECCDIKITPNGIKYLNSLI